MADCRGPVRSLPHSAGGDRKEAAIATRRRIQRAVERGGCTGYAGIGLVTNEVVVWWKGVLPAAVADTEHRNCVIV